MSIKLEDGSRFRIVDKNNQELNIENKALDSKNIKIQIDVDKDGKFDGKQDITIDNISDIQLLTDDIKGNAVTLKNIPFVNEIEQHILNDKQIQQLLEEAKKIAQQADKTSIFRKSKKIELGKIAFYKVNSAFYKDKANPCARFSYGMTIAKLKDSIWSGIAQDALGTNLDREAKVVMSELEKDKYDILGKMLLKKFYEVYDDKNNKKNIERRLSELKKEFPQDYKKAEEHFKEANSKG